MTEKINIKKLIIPLIFEQLLAVSVGMVDTLMVSTVGEVAVSGVALVDNLNRLIIQVMSAFCAGGVVISSQYYGSGNMKKTKKTCAQLDLIMLFASVLSMIVCLLFSRGILNLCFKGVEADVMDCAVTYLVVTSISYPFLASYNSGAAILRSIGDSKTGMNVSIVMNVINVAFNALFVFGLHMGVLGVGLATLLGRIAAAVIMRIKTESVKNPLKVEDKKDYLPDFGIIGKILKIGIPTGLESGMFQLGKLMVVGMITDLGTDAIAANSIAFQIIDFPNIPGGAIGLALIAVIGQDIGAGEKDMAIKDTKKMMKLAYIGDWSTKAILFIFVTFIVGAFNLSPSATETAILVIHCFCIASIPAWPLSFVLPNALKGAGDARYAMIIGILSMWLCRVLVSYILVKVFSLGVLGVWIGMFADWYVRAICYTFRFVSRKWLERKAI